MGRSICWPRPATRRSTTDGPVFARSGPARTSCGCEAYQAVLVCDGKDLYAAIEQSARPGSLTSRRPPRLTIADVFQDPILAEAMDAGLWRARMPQLMLLLGDNPLEALFRDSEEAAVVGAGRNRRPRLLPGEIKRPRRHGHLLDRSRELRPAAHRDAHRRAAPGNEPGKPDRQPFAGGRFHRCRG